MMPDDAFLDGFRWPLRALLHIVAKRSDRTTAAVIQEAKAVIAARVPAGAMPVLNNVPAGERGELFRDLVDLWRQHLPEVDGVG